MEEPKKKKQRVELTPEEILAQEPAPFELPKFMETKQFKFISALVSVLGIAVLPMLILWSKNANGLDVAEGLWPVLFSLAVGIIVFVLTWFAAKKNAPVVAFAGSVVSFFLLDFGVFISLAKKVLPFLPTAIGALIASVLLCGVALIIISRLKESKATVAALAIFAVTIVVLLGFNIIRTARGASKRVTRYARYEECQSLEEVPLKGEEAIAAAQNADTELVYQDPDSDEVTVVQPIGQEDMENLPNLYYFIMDEAADFVTMEKYYDMPTEENPLYQYCLEKGFSFSNDSYAYTNRSVYCMANVFSLGYVCTQYTSNTQARIRSFRGGWFYDLHNLGYRTYQVSSHTAHYLQLKELTEPTVVEQLLCSVTNEGSTVLDLFIDSSILSLVKAFAGDRVTKIDEIGASIFKKRMERVAAFYSDPENYTYDAPMAIHTYLLPPHTPFFTDAEGNTVSPNHRCDWVDPSYYRNQWLYMERYMEEIIDNILRYDPEAIIILQSDHGVRGGLWTNESYEIEREDQCRILNAVYYGGKQIDISGLSGVNTARKILTEMGSFRPQIQDMDFLYWQDQEELEPPVTPEYDEDMPLPPGFLTMPS